ncbi:MAG: 23S rRNA (adenine(2503)-C(2))-methyltransferase RlmN [Phycisphaeraceae bacterium]|nr:23S rRNA (adenine(2503)-C(2))-methyltransferase RlmN [Phycisphaeraceae bacterium]
MTVPLTISSPEAPPAAAQPDALGLTCSEYAEATRGLVLPSGATGGLAGAIERYRAFFRAGLRDLPHVGPGAGEVTRVLRSDSAEGVVRKFCQRVGGMAAGGKALETESVLIPMIGKKRELTHTLCVSSQVGCAMGCAFCQTAQMGKLRDLSASEIVGQWFAARHALSCDTIRNVVFMGMGEPTDNLDNVLRAIGVLTDSNGVGLPMSKVTVSTVGNVEGIRRLAEQVRRPGWHRLNLAVSLNAPNDEIRSRIMPVNRAWPMAEVRRAIEAWPIYGAAKICFEYVLIPGVNDAREHAHELADFVLGRGEHDGSTTGASRLPGMVNLIPYNPREDSPWPAPDESRVDEFLAWLIEEGVFAKRRRTKGRETMAACGQLGNPEIRRKRVLSEA